MNITKIEWCHWSLNAIVGCLFYCVYCYARRQAKRLKQRCELCYQFIPHPHLERLDQLNPKQKGRRIFMDSMWDWNSPGVEEAWLIKITEKMRECSQHTFQILSKRPKGYARFEFPRNVWIGTSIATTSDCYRIRDLSNSNGNNVKFVSIEPIHEKINFWFSKEQIDWIIIGAETGHRKGKIKAELEWINSIIENARSEGIPLFIKDNAQWHEKVREFPREI
jgi:protein gp37